MSYSEPLVNQIKIFLLSVGVGVLIFFAYAGVQCFFRFLSSKKGSIFFADIFFSIIAVLISFFFMVFYNNGRVRLHLIFGEALGYFVFYRCAGKYLLGLLSDLAQKLNRVVCFILYPFVRVGRAFVNSADEIRKFFDLLKNKNSITKKKKESSGEENNEKVKYNMKKFDLIRKIHLKNQNKSV